MSRCNGMPSMRWDASQVRGTLLRAGKHSAEQQNQQTLFGQQCSGQ